MYLLIFSPRPINIVFVKLTLFCLLTEQIVKLSVNKLFNFIENKKIEFRLCFLLNI